MTTMPIADASSDSERHSNTFWDGFIDEAAAADFIGFTVRCLQGWRYRGGGPPYHRIGGRIRYRRLDLADWAHLGRRSSTSAE